MKFCLFSHFINLINLKMILYSNFLHQYVAIGRQVLSRTVKAARAALKHWRPRLIAVMVECMSAFEPAMLQYMQFHTTRLAISDEELEQMRLRISQQSPMQEALDACLQCLDTATIPAVVRELCGQLHRGVGLATRVAAVKALAYLSGN